MNTIIKYMLAVAVGIILASAVWSKKSPPAPKIEYRDKIVEKTKTIRDIVTKDGETKIREVIVTVSAEESETKLSPQNDPEPQYSISAGAVWSAEDPLTPDYYLGAGRRLIGPVWVEAQVTTKKEILIGVKYEL